MWLPVNKSGVPSTRFPCLVKTLEATIIINCKLDDVVENLAENVAGDQTDDIIVDIAGANMILN